MLYPIAEALSNRRYSDLMLRILGEIALTSSLEGRFHNRNIYSVDGGMECGPFFLKLIYLARVPENLRTRWMMV
jgi:hypothetical protein